MKSINDESTANSYKDASKYEISDAKLKIAEFEKLKAELAKLNAESAEINNRLKQPWWYVKPSALIQAIIAGLIGGFLVGAFMLESFLNIHAVNVEQQETLRAENRNLENEKNIVAQQLAEVLRNNREQRDMIDELLNKRKDELASARQNLRGIRQKPSATQTEELAAQAEVESLEQTVGSLQEEASNVQQRIVELDRLVQQRLNEFKILIRYSSEPAEVDAVKVRSILQALGLDNIEVRQISKSEMTNRWGAEDYQIRYFEDTEIAEANVLQEKIQSSSDVRIRLQTASTPSPKLLSVFLP